MKSFALIRLSKITRLSFYEFLDVIFDESISCDCRIELVEKKIEENIGAP